MRFGEERQGNSSTTPCLLLHSVFVTSNVTQTHACTRTADAWLPIRRAGATILAFDQPRRAEGMNKWEGQVVALGLCAWKWPELSFKPQSFNDASRV